MEAYWSDVGNQLKRLNVFNESITQSAKLLHQKGFNLHSVLKNTDPITISDPFLSVVATTVVQVYVYINATAIQKHFYQN